MKVFTYTQARQKFSDVLQAAKREEVIIRRRSGDSFRLAYCAEEKSPLDIRGFTTTATTGDIIDAIRESRER